MRVPVHSFVREIALFSVNGVAGRREEQDPARKIRLGEGYELDFEDAYTRKEGR